MKDVKYMKMHFYTVSYKIAMLNMKFHLTIYLTIKNKNNIIKKHA